jgi:hydrogenase nickel incorporation protein HypA/HybF
MHELSIAMSIVEMAEEEAESRGVRISAVRLKLGVMSGVVKEALLSCYELACEGTSLAGSRLLVDEIPVIVFCPRCDEPRPLNTIQLFACSECGTSTPEILQGKELEVVGLEIAA